MNDRPIITCRELIDFIADYLDGALAPTARDDFERHLARCPSCVAYLESYRQTVRLGTLAFARTDDPVDAHVPEGLIRAIHAARAGSRHTARSDPNAD